MNSNGAERLHALAEQRYDLEKLMEQVNYLAVLPVLKEGFDATNSMILIINSYRQAIFANKAFLQMANIKERSEIYGKRGGELIRCIYANDGISGCGTAEACRYCNAVNTVLKAIETKEELSNDFSVINTISGYEKSINFSIYVAPLKIQDEYFYVISFLDNSDSIRKKMLEKIFFHDIINTVGALKGIMSLLKEDVPDVIKPELEFVEEAFKYLVEEIQAQKDMIYAENDQLILEISSKGTIEILRSISKLYEGHDIAINKTIKLDQHCIKKNIRTDHRILRRILGNMIKNALEATEQGSTIALGCSIDGDRNEWIKFWVHNDQYMDDEVQSQVFHRSFSTKGDGRGLGTYSVKLFGEKYLKGKVSFSTEEKRGTSFYIRLPLHLSIAE